MASHWGDVDEAALLEALERAEDQEASSSFIYIRRGYRASDEGTGVVETGHFKVGRTSRPNVADRNTDGSMPTSSRPIAQWRVPANRAVELEARVHAALAAFNIKLDHGREWFTVRKVIGNNSEFFDSLALHEQWLVAIIDGCLLIRHEPVSPPVTTEKPPAKRRRSAIDPGNDAVLKKMLATWNPPVNHPPTEMVEALRRAVKACTDLPPRRIKPASDKTAKSTRLALNVAAVFRRYTEWDGRDVMDIIKEPVLKRFLDASKVAECRLFGAGSDCGGGSGSQALGWCAGVAELVATRAGTNVTVRMNIGEQVYEWRVEWADTQ